MAPPRPIATNAPEAMASAVAFFLTQRRGLARWGSIQRGGRLKPPTPHAAAGVDASEEEEGGLDHEGEMLIIQADR